MSRPVRCCSRMCADHPALRAHANSAVKSSCGHARAVEHDRRPELDVRGQHAVGLAGAQLLERGALELLRHREARGAQLLRCAAQHAGARILRPVDAVPEAHQPLAAVERRAHPAGGVAGPLHLVEHPQHARRRAAVQRSRQRADRGAHRGQGVGPGGGDDPRGERRRVHPVLGRGDPVGVDGLGVTLVGLAAPGEQEALREGAPLVDDGVRHRRAVGAAGRLRGERQQRRRRTRELVAGGRRVDVDERRDAPRRGERGDGGLQIGTRVAGADGQELVAGRGEPGVGIAVDEQAPDALERDAARQLAEVDAAVAQRAPVAIGLGDLGGEGDDAFEAWMGDRGHGFRLLPSRVASSMLIASICRRCSSRAETARRLGVKPQTVYAYVSRGLLTASPRRAARRASTPRRSSGSRSGPATAAGPERSRSSSTPSSRCIDVGRAPVLPRPRRDRARALPLVRAGRRAAVGRRRASRRGRRPRTSCAGLRAPRRPRCPRRPTGRAAARGRRRRGGDGPAARRPPPAAVRAVGRSAGRDARRRAAGALRRRATGRSRRGCGRGSPTTRRAPRSCRRWTPRSCCWPTTSWRRRRSPRASPRRRGRTPTSSSSPASARSAARCTAPARARSRRCSPRSRHRRGRRRRARRAAARRRPGARLRRSASTATATRAPTRCSTVLRRAPPTRSGWRWSTR